MEKEIWHQPPYCTTLMGCIQGAADYFGLDYSPAMLFGLTGHAFLINIHKLVCPSGPYAWNHSFFYELLDELGLHVTESPFMTPLTGEEERKREMERLLLQQDRGMPSMLTCLEHQLIKSVEGNTILLISPWDGEVESQFSTVRGEDFSPCLDRAGFIQFSYFEKTPAKRNLGKAVHRSLRMAADLYAHPEKLQLENYQAGFGAYEYWITALQKEEYDEHGHWWNGMVWAENRDMASRFFGELEGMNSNLDGEGLSLLGRTYRTISERLSEAKERELEREKKIILLTEALEMEYEANYLVEKILTG